VADQLYIEPNRKLQISVLLLVALFAVIGALLQPSISPFIPDQGAPLADIKRALNLGTVVLLGATVIAFIVSLAWVVYFYRLGSRSLKLGTFPPPDAIVLFRERVRTGREAVRDGYLSIVFALLVGLFAAVMAYGIWLLTTLLLAARAL
jgi:hypothetical protein